MTRDDTLLLSAASCLLALAVDAERYVDISDVGEAFAVIHRGDDHPGVRVFRHEGSWMAVDQAAEAIIGMNETVTSLLSTPAVVRKVRAALDRPYAWLPEELYDVVEVSDRDLDDDTVDDLRVPGLPEPAVVATLVH